MKKYNKPGMEIAEIEVKDVIATSFYGAGADSNTKSAFSALTDTYSDLDPLTETLIFEW